MIMSSFITNAGAGANIDDGSVTSGAGVEIEIIAAAANRSQTLGNSASATGGSGGLRIQDDSFNFNDDIDDELSSRDRDEDEECHTSTSNQEAKPKASFFGFSVSRSGCYNYKVLGSVMILGLFFILMSTGISGVVKDSRNRMASTDGSKLLIQAKGSKGNKNDDSEELCPVGGINLPLSDTCDVDVEQGVTTTDMVMAYGYVLIVNDEDQDEDDVDHIISCNEVTLHQSLLGSFCPSALRAKSRKKKKKKGEEEGSIGIVASISSSPNDLSVDTTSTCPVTVQLGDNESCRAITGGLTLQLQFASAIERRRLGYGTSKEKDGMSSNSGSEWIKDGSMSRGLQELDSEREALKNMLLAVMTAMNENLGLDLQPDDAIAFVDNLSDDFLLQLMNGELNLDANVSDGNFVVDTVGPPSSEPSTSTSPSISLQPSASLQPSSCGCFGLDACEGNTGEFVLMRLRH